MALSRLLVASGALLAVLACAGQAMAQETQELAVPVAGGQEVYNLDTVEVQGRRLKDAVSSFIGEVSANAGRNEQLARFEQRVCPGVIGLPAEHAQVINDRIAEAALRVNLAVGRPGCFPNVLVIATDDSDRLARELMDEHRLTFKHHVNGQERGSELLAEFARPGRLVRWWHMTELTSAGTLNSRLKAAVRTDIYRSIIIVDTARIGAVSVPALGDYVAMTALARLSPDADTREADTILNLFDSPRGSVAGLTSWDMAYLQGLYSAESASAHRNLQEADMAWWMARRVRQGEGAEPN